MAAFTSSFSRASVLILIGAVATAVVFFIGSASLNVFSYQDDAIVVTGSQAENDKLLAKFKHMLTINEKLHKFFVNQSADRQKLLGSFLDQQTASREFGSYYNALAAEIVCPWLARVGNVDDGGKWICNPWALPDNCIIYSLGVGPDVTFEFEMDNVAEKRCKFYSFDPDPTLGKRLVERQSERFVFSALKIASRNNEHLRERTVESIMMDHEHKFIDFLKIDIEGSEFGVVPPLLSDKDKPIACQIFIEMHGTPHQCATLVSQISKGGFWMFFYERNGYYPTASEYSFLHESCFERYGVSTVLARNFPT